MRRLRYSDGCFLIGAPRHLSQHPGGFVLTHDRLDELVPIEPAAMKDRQVIEWDKDDIDALRFMKVDVPGARHADLHAARSSTCWREHKGIDLDLATIPAEDPSTYAMIRKADTLGTFQIESRGADVDAAAAQARALSTTSSSRWRSSVPARSRATWCIPICAGARAGNPSTIPRPNLKRCWARPSACRCFRNRPCSVAIECAGFTPGEADQLRRSMATFKHTGGVSKFRDKLIAGMVAKRLPAGVRGEDVQPVGGVRQLRVSGKPRGLFRADRLRFVLAEMPPSRRVLRARC